MRRIIRKVDYENNIFACLIGGNYLYFYLTKSLARKYLDFLEVGVFVTFEIANQTKIVAGIKSYKVKYFTKIEKKTYLTTKELYNIETVRKQILAELTQDEHYLFIDFEMTMPPYYKVSNFQPEIIQVGYYLTNKELEPIKKDTYYLKPSKYPRISKRTFKFLNLKREVFSKAKTYSYFYADLKKIIEGYNPKIIIWGKNDYLAITKSYRINKVKPLTTKSKFINLLNKIKTFYNLSDDIGLFKAYEGFYQTNSVQSHHAFRDAKITLQVYQAFITKNS
ncbi:MAG: hypothetical protein GX149_04525 [Acholeplasmataceae bacterium]|jgi:sporulation inhibitor KapD|nr:hypothetical protein [Acholeplasmataceae bacterium]